jgi:hypothetical protein
MRIDERDAPLSGASMRNAFRTLATRVGLACALEGRTYE